MELVLCNDDHGDPFHSVRTAVNQFPVRGIFIFALEMTENRAVSFCAKQNLRFWCFMAPQVCVDGNGKCDLLKDTRCSLGFDLKRRTVYKRIFVFKVIIFFQLLYK